MGMVELIQERESLLRESIRTGSKAAALRLDEVHEEICRIVKRSSSMASLVVVAHKGESLVVDLEKRTVRDAIDRSALFVDSMLDPYGKVDRNAQTTEIADFAELEVAF